MNILENITNQQVIESKQIYKAVKYLQKSIKEGLHEEFLDLSQQGLVEVAKDLYEEEGINIMDLIDNYGRENFYKHLYFSSKDAIKNYFLTEIHSERSFIKLYLNCSDEIKSLVLESTRKLSNGMPSRDLGPGVEALIEEFYGSHLKDCIPRYDDLKETLTEVFNKAIDKLKNIED